jgi:hypothetical protein
MEKFTVTQSYSFDEKCYQWKVFRVDGKSFRDGVISYNFPYNEQGAIDAINCRNKLEQRYEFLD